MKKTNLLNRRSFFSQAACLTAATGLFMGNTPSARAHDAGGRPPKFKLRYAPHPGMFKASAGDSVIDQIKFAADQGFTGWEDNGLPGQPPAMQEKIGKTLSDLGMKMGVFVAYGNFDEPVFATNNAAKHDEILQKIRDAVDIAKRVGAQWFTVVPGSVDQQTQGDKWNKYGGPRLAEGYQTANVIGLLRRCAEILEPHKLTMVLEPLNWEANHGGVFLRHSDQAYAICKAVNSPACKILFDIYHQQITEGNLIPNIEHCWDEIGYFQSGDNPGRKEPGTGEINYRGVFKYIHDRSRREDRDFVIGMEHGNSKPGKPGELAVIQAYRDADAF
jgi:hydroxypyruvate isomerase